MTLRVVIAEDQAMILGALAALLETEGDIEVVGQARDGREALRLTVSEKPDLLLADIEMPEMTGLEVAAEIKRERLPVRVVILTTFARAGYLRRALDAGASGYLLKDSPASALADALRRIHAGGRVIDPELAAKGDGSRALVCVLGVVDGLQELHLAFRIVRQHQLERAQDRHHTQSRPIQILPDVIFELLEFRKAVRLGHAEIARKSAQTLRRVAAPAHPANSRHSGIIPAFHHALLHQLQQLALAH